MSGFQTNLAWDTLLELGDGRDGPLHARLSSALRQAIRDGRLPAGSALPPSRTLAEDLGCSRWVVTEAYAQLAAEGYVDARVGAGTRVRSLGRAAAGHPAPEAPPAWVPRIDLAPGLPDLRAFPLDAGSRRCARSPAPCPTPSWATRTPPATPGCATSWPTT